VARHIIDDENAEDPWKKAQAASDASIAVSVVSRKTG
jgi:hypothetical protein